MEIELPPKEVPSAVITVRMVPSLHERIRETSHRERMSINGLCLAAIKNFLDRSDEAHRLASENLEVSRLQDINQKTFDHLQAEPATA